MAPIKISARPKAPIGAADWAAISARANEVIQHEKWLDVERNAREVRLLRLQFRLGSGPFKLLLILAIGFLAMAFSGSAHAEPSASLPDAPKSQAVTISAGKQLAPVDWMLAGSIVASRAGDYFATSECLRNTLHNGCHERLLPNVLVHDRAAFAAFETGAASVEILSEYILVRGGHRKLARSVAMFNSGLSLAVDGITYSAARAR